MIILKKKKKNKQIDELRRKNKWQLLFNVKKMDINHLGGGPVIRAWD
jgi:hypothetical protein